MAPSIAPLPSYQHALPDFSLFGDKINSASAPGAEQNLPVTTHFNKLPKTKAVLQTFNAAQKDFINNIILLNITYAPPTDMAATVMKTKLNTLGDFTNFIIRQTEDHETHVNNVLSLPAANASAYKPTAERHIHNVKVNRDTLLHNLNSGTATDNILSDTLKIYTQEITHLATLFKRIHQENLSLEQDDFGSFQSAENSVHNQPEKSRVSEDLLTFD